MSAVLGVSGYYHDAAAALVIDGKVVAAMQEERLSRRKNDPGLPRKAAQSCLSMAGLEAADLDKIVFYEDPFARLERATLSCFKAFPASWKQFPSTIQSQIGSKIWVLDGVAEMLGVVRTKIVTVGHHESHAASAFYASPYRRAAVLTIDGMGEDTSTALWLGDNEKLSCLAKIPYPHSIGLLYATVTSLLGFEVNEGEYKVMGLAAFGAPRFKAEFAKLVKLQANGAFELDMNYFAFHTETEISYSRHMEHLLGPRRTRGKPWDIENCEADQRYADIAASLQWITEEAILSLAKEAKRRTDCGDLCIAGGVALNCVANARLLRDSGFSRIFVQPAAGDAGGALGAAFLGSIALDGRRPEPMTTAALGLPISTGVARDLCAQLGLRWSEPADPLAVAADMIARDQICAFVRGRFEWGPRALGQRSILVSPQKISMRDRLNRIVKRREAFRPFAPAVLASSAGAWFSECDNDMAPYMTTAAQVKMGREADLGAVRHVDGTARVQTVTSGRAADLCGVLERLEIGGAPPIVLNTSLNGAGEPIVAREVDALGFFLSHPVDCMMLGDIMLSKK